MVCPVLSCCCHQKLAEHFAMSATCGLLVQSEKPSELVNVLVKELVADCMFGVLELKQIPEVCHE